MLWDLNEFILVTDYLDFHSESLYYTYLPGLQDRRSLRLSWTVIGQLLSSERWGLLLIDRCWYDKQDLEDQDENRRRKNMLLSCCCLEDNSAIKSVHSYFQMINSSCLSADNDSKMKSQSEMNMSYYMTGCDEAFWVNTCRWIQASATVLSSCHTWTEDWNTNENKTDW